MPERYSTEQKPLEAGYGERIITPPVGTELAGYGFFLERRTETVLDDLRVRCLVLRQGETQIILISCDLIGFSVDSADALRQRVAGRWHIPPYQVMLACTHTHSGPATKPTLGLGEMNPDYMSRLPGWIDDAVEDAAGDLRSCSIRAHEESIEAIGFNRRNLKADSIDPILQVAVFERPDLNIYIASYACHPVMIGRGRDVTADWPGAMANALSREGHRAIVLQGCCGDVDPITSLYDEGHGSAQDLENHGMLLAQRAQWVALHAPVYPVDHIEAIEKRIALPLAVWNDLQIAREAQSFLERFGQFPGAERFAKEWMRRAIHARAAYANHPYIDNVPIQAIRIGKLRILGLPGEPFTQLGTQIRQASPATWVIGYANGTVGYFPTREAFSDPADYACYCAPRFITLFPFAESIEDILVKESLALLSSLTA
jgi:hypothetical protein